MSTNIIFIMTDDQTLNTINATGNKQVITPNLDKLCKSGMVFNNCHISGGTSGAICMPSRAVAHTGKNLFGLTNAGQSIDADSPLLGETLKNNGYETFFTGKWHNGLAAFNRSFTQGDNIFFGGMWDHYNVPMNIFDPSGEYDNHVDYVVNFFNSSDKITMLANKFNPGIHSTDVVTKSAIEFIKKYESSKPFFLNVAYLAPHDPRVVPEKYLDMYENIEVCLPVNFQTRHPFLFGQENERDEILAPKPLSDEWVKKELKAYYAMITHIDAEVGKLLIELEKKGLKDDTLIIFTSDNGLSLGAHGLIGKQSLYDEAVRVPLIISGPNVRANSENSKLVLLQDIFPTILEYLSLPQIEVEGVSFAPSLCNNDYDERELLYLGYTDLIRAIKTKEYKYIKYRSNEGEEIHQLFDLSLDPGEQQNVYDSKEYFETKIFLEQLLCHEKKIYEKYDNLFTDRFWEKI